MKKLFCILLFPVFCSGQYTSIPDSIFEQRLIDFGYDTIHDGQVLTLNIVNVDSLSLYYIPCKAKQYLTDLTEKKCITVLRQLLKIHNYTLFSKEKFVKGKKHLFYQVIPIQVELLTTNRTQNQIIISFD